MKKLKDITKQFKNKRIIVVGDIMLDEYIFGDIKGKSPEAPVLLVRVKDRQYVPGGAGNAAVNLAALGARVYLIGIKGNDVDGDILIAQLRRRGINTDCILDARMPTIVKTRIICEGQQMLRYDTEQEGITFDHVEKMTDFIRKRIRDIDGILISDYNKGMNILSPEIIGLCSRRKKPVVADSKSLQYLFYKNVSLFTPNLHDAMAMAGTAMSPEKAAETLGNRLQSDILITMGSSGMLLYESGTSTHLPVKPIEKCDATGAGDTVSATALLALCSGATRLQAATIAQAAARVVIQKIGTANLNINELNDEINNL